MVGDKPQGFQKSEGDSSGLSGKLGLPPPPFRTIGQSEARARQAYRLTQFLMRLKKADERVAFKKDPTAYISNAGLSEYEVEMLLNGKYGAMHDYGVPMVAVGKILGVQGVPMTELTRSVREHCAKNQNS